MVLFHILIHKSLMFVKYSTPGNTFPSNNSNDAPPPVDT